MFFMTVGDQDQHQQTIAAIMQHVALLCERNLISIDEVISIAQDVLASDTNQISLKEVP
jgi:hypothetical protein